MFAVTRITVWLILLIVFGVIGFTVLLSKGNGRLGFVRLLSILFVLGFLTFLVGVFPHVPPQPSPPIAVAYTEGGGEIKFSEQRKTQHPTAVDPTLEALWDKLTKSRINLDVDNSEPVADPADETAKGAVKDTFGLDDKGKLPPKWVITPPKQVGQVYRASVASDLWATEEECRQQLVENVLPQTVARRIEYLAPSRVNRKVSVADPLLLGIGPDYILREICRDEFTGTVDSSVGEMKKVHVLLEFDENIDNYLVDAWLRHERQIRFASVSKVAALSLTGLAAIYGLLRFDTWSKGYYSGRLLVGGTLAIIALAVLVLKT